MQCSHLLPVDASPPLRLSHPVDTRPLCRSDSSDAAFARVSRCSLRRSADLEPCDASSHAIPGESVMLQTYSCTSPSAAACRADQHLSVAHSSDCPDHRIQRTDLAVRLSSACPTCCRPTKQKFLRACPFAKAPHRTLAQAFIAPPQHCPDREAAKPHSKGVESPIICKTRPARYSFC